MEATILCLPDDILGDIFVHVIMADGVDYGRVGPIMLTCGAFRRAMRALLASRRGALVFDFALHLLDEWERIWRSIPTIRRREEFLEKLRKKRMVIERARLGLSLFS